MEVGAANQWYKISITSEYNEGKRNESFFFIRFPTPEGYCNNRVNTHQGAKERTFKRMIEANYEDEHGE